MDKNRRTCYSTLLAVALLIGAALVVYIRTVYFPFEFDDSLYITENPLIRSLSNFFVPVGTRYMGYLSFAINYKLAGFNVAVFRLTNIGIHILNSLLVFALVSELFRTPGVAADKRLVDRSAAFGVALATALIFTVHPVQTQPVIYISQRFATLATTFYLASFLFYIRWRNREGTSAALLWAIALVSAVLAQMTKEISFTLPIVLVLAEYVFYPPAPGAKRKLAPLIPFIATLVIIPLNLFGPGLFDGGGAGAGGAVGAGGAGAMGAQSVGRDLLALQMRDLKLFSPYHYFVTELRVIVTYLRLLVLPVNQSLMYDYPLYRTLFAPQVLASLVFLALILISAVYTLIRSIKKTDCLLLLASFGALFFFLSLSIESSVIPIKDVIYEHRLYLPGIGATLAFVCVAFRVIGRFKGREGGFQKATVALIIVTVLPLGAVAFARGGVWRSPLDLWKDTAEKAPLNEQAQYNLGRSYQEAGDADRAKASYKAALRLNPDKEKAHNNIAAIYLSNKEYEPAIFHYKEVIRVNPANHTAYYNLAMIYQMTNRTDEAIEMYLLAIRIKPDYEDAHYNLAYAFQEIGARGTADAILHYREVIRLNQASYDAHHNLGRIYWAEAKRTGKSQLRERAERELRTSLKIRPGYAPAKRLLDEVLRSGGNN